MINSMPHIEHSASKRSLPDNEGNEVEEKVRFVPSPFSFPRECATLRYISVQRE